MTYTFTIDDRGTVTATYDCGTAQVLDWWTWHAAAVRQLIAEIAAKDAEIARLRDALAPVAAYPLEDFGIENSRESKPLFGANNWRLTVGDVRQARAALVQVAEVGK